MESDSDMPDLVYSSDDEDNRPPQSSMGSAAAATGTQKPGKASSAQPKSKTQGSRTTTKSGGTQTTVTAAGKESIVPNLARSQSVDTAAPRNEPYTIDEFLAGPVKEFEARRSKAAALAGCSQVYVMRWISAVDSETYNCPYVYKSYMVLKIYLVGPLLFGMRTRSSVADDMLRLNFVDHHTLKAPRPISYENVMKVGDFEWVIDRVIEYIRVSLDEDPEDMEDAITNTNMKLFKDHMPVNIRDAMNKDPDRKMLYMWAFREFVEHVRLNHQSKNVTKMTYEENLKLDKESYACKEEGNKSFKDKNFTQAVMFYSRAIEISRLSYILYGNRAQAYLRLNQPEQALSDGLRAIILKPDWPKGYYRFAEAFLKMEYYDTAFKINEDGLKRCGSDANLVGQKDKIKTILREQRKNKKEAAAEENIREIGRKMDGDINKNDVRAAARKVLKPHNEPASPIPALNSSAPSQKLPESPEELYDHHLKEGTNALLKKDFTDAVHHYQSATSQIFNLKTKPTELNQLLIKYAHATALVGVGSDRDVRTALKMLDGLSPSKAFPLGYLGKVRALVRQNRYVEAMPVITEGLRIVRGKCSFGKQRWPASSTVIEDTEVGEMRNQLQKLLMLCRYPPAPVAVCRHQNCAGYYKPQIYRLDTDFSGYVRVQCWEQCILEFHNECWKAYKNQQLVIKKGDKDIVNNNEPCPTPDCDSMLAKIAIYDDKGNRLKEFVGKKVTQAGEKKKITKMTPSSLKTIQQRTEKKANRQRKRREAKGEVLLEDEASTAADNLAEAALAAAASSADKAPEPAVEELPHFTEVLRKGDDDPDLPLKGGTAKGKRVRRRTLKTENVITPDLRFKDNPGRSVVDDTIFVDPYEYVAPPVKAEMGLDGFDDCASPGFDHANPFTMPADQENDLLRFMDMDSGSGSAGGTVSPPLMQPSSPPKTSMENFHQHWGVATSSPGHGASSLDDIIYTKSDDEEEEQENTPPSGGDTSPGYRPNRSADLDTENAVRDSVFSHFSNLLRDTGPMNVEDPQLLRAAAELDASTQEEIKKSGGLGGFLRQSVLFYYTSGFICNYELQDIQVARQLAEATSSTSHQSLLSQSRNSLTNLKDRGTVSDHSQGSSSSGLDDFSAPIKNKEKQSNEMMMNIPVTTLEMGNSGQKDDGNSGQTARSLLSDVMGGKLSSTDCYESDDDDGESDNSFSDIDEDDSPRPDNDEQYLSLSGSDGTKKVDTSATSHDEEFFDSKENVNASSPKSHGTTPHSPPSPSSVPKPQFPATQGKLPPGFALPSVTSPPQSAWNDYCDTQRPADQNTSPEATSNNNMKAAVDLNSPPVTSEAVTKSESAVASEAVPKNKDENPQTNDKTKVGDGCYPSLSDQVATAIHQYLRTIPEFAHLPNIKNIVDAEVGKSEVVQLQKYLEDTVGKNMNARRDKGHKDIDGLAGSLETVRSDLKKKEIQCSKAEAKVKDLNVQLQEARCGKAKIEKEQRRLQHDWNEEKLKITKENRALRNQQEQLSIQVENVKKKTQKEKDKVEASVKVHREKAKHLETENAKLQESLDDKTRQLSESQQERQALSDTKTELGEQLRRVQEQRSVEKSRAQSAEVQLLQLKLDVAMASLERHLQHCEDNIGQFTQHIKSLHERKQLIPPSVNEGLTQWNRTKDAIKQRLVHAKSMFQQQITLVNDGIQMSSLPAVEIPRPPTPPSVTLQSFLGGPAVNSPVRRSSAKESSILNMSDGLARSGAGDAILNEASRSSSASSTPPPVPQGATAADNSATKTKNSSYNRVLESLRSLFQGIYSKAELRNFIQEVRAMNGGSLSGMTLDQIVQKVTEVILREQGMHGSNTQLPNFPPPSSTTSFSTPSEAMSLDDEDPCVICFSDMTALVDTVDLKCGHRFHTGCIRQWLQKQSTCPNCRVHALLPDEYPPLC